MDDWYIRQCKRSTAYAYALGWIKGAAETAADAMERNGLVEQAARLRRAIAEAQEMGERYAEDLYAEDVAMTGSGTSDRRTA